MFRQPRPASWKRRLLPRVAALLAALGAREPEPQRPAADGTLLTMPQVAKRLGVPDSEAAPHSGAWRRRANAPLRPPLLPVCHPTGNRRCNELKTWTARMSGR